MLSLINFSQIGGMCSVKKGSGPKKSAKKYVWIANYPSGKAMYKYFKTLEERKKYIDSFNKKYYKKKSAKKASVRPRHSHLLEKDIDQIGLVHLLVLHHRK